MTKRAFQAMFPTFTPVVQIGPSPGQFPGWIDLHSSRRPDNTDHLPLGQNFTTAHACPLRHVLDSLNRFLRHLHLKSLPCATTLSLYYQSSPSSSSPRLCFLRPTTSPRSSSSTSSTLFFLPFLPFFLSAESSSSAPGVWKISGFIEKSSSNETPSLACSSSSDSSTFPFEGEVFDSFFS